MSTQTHDLHRALLRPFVIHTLRAAGFHSTKPSVLDTLVNVAERYLLLLASTTAQHARNAHNDITPTISDVRMAMQDCGVLVPVEGAGEEAWREILRVPVAEMEAEVEGGGNVGASRARAEKRKREEEDIGRDVRGFVRWFDGARHAEIRRIAGMVPDTNVAGGAAVGVGGGVVQAEDFLATLKKRYGKGGDEGRLSGTVLGRQAEDKGVVVEGGPVQHLREWRPRLAEKVANALPGRKESAVGSGMEDVLSVRDVPPI